MIYEDSFKPLMPTYVVEMNEEACHIPASKCLIDTDLKIICFYDKGSVQAMFRLEDVKAFWRIF